MSTESLPPKPPVNPRPGVLKTLGILNIVFSVLGVVCIAWSGLTMYAMNAASAAARPPEAKVEAQAPATPKPAGTIIAAMNPFIGMNEPKFVMFSYVENGIGFIINGLMFATGIGLLSLKRWAARGWTWLAWFRIASLPLIWGYFVVGVAPAFSKNMASEMIESLKQQNPGQPRLPTVEYITQVCSIMCLIMAVGAIVFTSIYPAISIWLLSRPGVKAALVDKPSTEPELS